MSRLLGHGYSHREEWFSVSAGDLVALDALPLHSAKPVSWARRALAGVEPAPRDQRPRALPFELQGLGLCRLSFDYPSSAIPLSHQPLLANQVEAGGISQTLLDDLGRAAAVSTKHEIEFFLAPAVALRLGFGEISHGAPCGACGQVLRLPR